MKKSIVLFLFLLAFITFVTVSIGFSLQNEQIHKPIIIAVDNDNSVDEEAILEEEQGQLENNEQNEKYEVDPGIYLDKPEEPKIEVDPGIFLGDPEGPINEIDPGIEK